MNRPGLAIGAAVLSLVIVTGGGFIWAQTRVSERDPTPDEALAMVTVEDLVGQVPEGSGTAELLVRAFPSMPMLWLNYRRGGPVQVRSHLLRYDDEDLANTGVERFAEGDGRWVGHLDLQPMPLPDCVDGGSLGVAPGEGFLLTARRGGTYVHVSAIGWAPESHHDLGRGICPSLEALDRLPFPPPG